MGEFFQFSRRPTLIAKGIIIAIPLVALFVVINHHLLLTASASYRYRPEHPARVIIPAEPATLIQSADPNLRWRLTTNRFPFQVTVPYQIAAVRVQGILHSGTQPVVYLAAAGAQGSEPRRLISSSFLDVLAWHKITDGTATLWMRDVRRTTEKKIVGTGKDQHEVDSTWAKEVRQYRSIAEFRSDPPELKSIATVGYDRLALTKFPTIEPDKGTVTLPQTFRGSHQFYVYSTGPKLTIRLDKIDRNRGKGGDPMTVRVGRAEDLSARKQNWLTTIKVKDDGNTGGSGPQGKPQRVELTVPTPRPGAYFIQLETSEDVLFTNLTSSAHRLSFTDRVFIAEGPAYGQPDFRPLTILTNGSSLTLAAAHDQGKQDIAVAGKKYSLKGVNVEVVAAGLKEITSALITKPDIKMSSDGLLTIMPAQILPSAGTMPLDLLASPNLEAVDYVFAEYQPQSGPTIHFDETYRWTELEPRGKRLSFAIEAPGLEVNETTLALQELRATLQRGPFPWSKIWQKL